VKRSSVLPARSRAPRAAVPATDEDIRTFRVSRGDEIRLVRRMEYCYLPLELFDVPPGPDFDEPVWITVDQRGGDEQPTLYRVGFATLSGLQLHRDRGGTAETSAERDARLDRALGEDTMGAGGRHATSRT
jgi:hypothetical protein